MISSSSSTRAREAVSLARLVAPIRERLGNRQLRRNGHAAGRAARCILRSGQYYLVQLAQGTAGTAPLPAPDFVDPTPINMSATGGKIALVKSAMPLGCNGGSAPCAPPRLEAARRSGRLRRRQFLRGGGPAAATSNTTAEFRAGGGCIDTDDNAADFPRPHPRRATRNRRATTVRSSMPVRRAARRRRWARKRRSPRADALRGQRIRDIQGPRASLAARRRDRGSGSRRRHRRRRRGVLSARPLARCRRRDLGGDLRLHEHRAGRHGGRLRPGERRGRRVSTGLRQRLHSDEQRLFEPDHHRDPAAHRRRRFIGQHAARPDRHRTGMRANGTRRPPSSTMTATGSVEKTPSELRPRQRRHRFLREPRRNAGGGERRRRGGADQRRLPPARARSDLARRRAPARACARRAAGSSISATDYNPERIVLSNVLVASSPDVNVGDKFTGTIVGVIDYAFAKYNLLNTDALPARGVALRSCARHSRLPNRAATDLDIASFNVENLDPADPPEKFARLAGIVVAEPEIAGHRRASRKSRTTTAPPTTAPSTPPRPSPCWRRRSRTAGGPSYQFRNIDPENGQDGGEPGGNIRAGFLFRTDRGLFFTDRAGGHVQHGQHRRRIGRQADARLQPRPHRSHERRFRVEPQAPRRRIDLPRAHGLRHREPLQLQGGRPAALRALSAAHAFVGSTAPPASRRSSPPSFRRSSPSMPVPPWPCSAI